MALTPLLMARPLKKFFLRLPLPIYFQETLCDVFLSITTLFCSYCAVITDIQLTIDQLQFCNLLIAQLKQILNSRKRQKFLKSLFTMGRFTGTTGPRYCPLTTRNSIYIYSRRLTFCTYLLLFFLTLLSFILMPF